MAGHDHVGDAGHSRTFTFVVAGVFTPSLNGAACPKSHENIITDGWPVIFVRALPRVETFYSVNSIR
jgi:hypothetical protein